jgi:hypothetical protein
VLNSEKSDAKLAVFLDAQRIEQKVTSYNLSMSDHEPPGKFKPQPCRQKTPNSVQISPENNLHSYLARHRDVCHRPDVILGRGLLLYLPLISLYTTRSTV